MAMGPQDPSLVMNGETHLSVYGEKTSNSCLFTVKRYDILNGIVAWVYDCIMILWGPSV